MRPPLLWTHDLSVGDPTIDAQHQALFDRTAAVGQAIDAATSRARLADLITFLADYTIGHFREEEARMTRAGYPDLVAHRRAHRAFLLEVGDVWEALGKGPAGEAQVAQFYARICDWLVDHVGDADRDFGRWTRAQGIPLHAA